MRASNWRSKNSMTPAAVSTGNVIRMSRLVTKMFQVNTGMRNIVMPGARMQITVAITLSAVSTPDSPSNAMPTIHRSPPTFGERTPSESGAYPYQPNLAAPSLVANPPSITMPANRVSQ